MNDHGAHHDDAADATTTATAASADHGRGGARRFECDSRQGAALRGMWCEPPSDSVLVRGVTYMDDQRKVPAGASLGELLHVDVWHTRSADDRHHIARSDRVRADSVIAHCAVQHPDALVFLLNIQLPDAAHRCLVSYWLLRGFYSSSSPSASSASLAHSAEDTNPPVDSAFQRLLRRFCSAAEDGPDNGTGMSFRDTRFKLIPRLVTAPLLLHQVVPECPALTGRKLTQRYYRGANYFEVDMDVSSSVAARSVGSLCQNAAAYLEVDVFITVQGEQEDELPEQVLGGVRFSYMDLTLATPAPAVEQPVE